MSTDVIVSDQKPSLIQRLSSSVGLEPAKFYAAVKTTCGCAGATDENFAVLLMVADKYQLNPMLRQLYLMPTKKGVEVVIPIDGWVPLLTHHADYLAHEVELQWAEKPFLSKCVAATLRIWTRSRNALQLGPFEHTEMMEECWKDTGPWKSHPTRMLGHKVVIQGARRCFGIYVMDADEAAGIGIEATAMPTPTTRIARIPKEMPEETDTVSDAVVESVPESTSTNGVAAAFARRIELATSPKETAQIALEIGEALSDGGLTQQEADDLTAAMQ